MVFSLCMWYVYFNYNYKLSLCNARHQQDNFQTDITIFLNDTRFDNFLLSTPQTLQDYIFQYKQKKEIFIWKKGMTI